MRRTLIVLVGALACASAAVATAWACTPSPRSFSVIPEVAAPGTQARVIGEGMPAGSPVEIRWNGIAGTLIGVTHADARGAFSATVSIPDAAPGIHAIVFNTGDDSRAAVKVGRLAFQVASPAELAAGTSGGIGPSKALGSVTNLGTPAGSHQSSAGRSTGLALLGLGAAGLCVATLVTTSRRHRAKVTV